MLINPPYWPGRPLIVSIIFKLYQDFLHRLRERRLIYWLIKNVWSFGYLFTDVVRSLQIVIFAGRRDFYERLPNKQILLVHNDDDAWCAPDIQKIPFKNKDVTFFSFPGEHDDCWMYPEKYIGVLKTHA